MYLCTRAVFSCRQTAWPENEGQLCGSLLQSGWLTGGRINPVSRRHCWIKCLNTKYRDLLWNVVNKKDNWIPKNRIKTEFNHFQTNCVYRQRFYKVFLSPCSDIIHTIMCFPKWWTLAHPHMWTTSSLMPFLFCLCFVMLLLICYHFYVPILLVRSVTVFVVSVCYHIFAPVLFFICALDIIESDTTFPVLSCRLSQHVWNTMLPQKSIHLQKLKMLMRSDSEQLVLLTY